jgi:hypothetical protein
MLGLWLTWQPVDPWLAKRREHRRQVIMEQLQELNVERKAVETAKTEVVPAPAPGRPPLPETTRVVRKEESEEAARFIEARQRFMMRQLRMFNTRRPLPDDLDVDEFDPNAPTRAEEPALAQTDPVEVGRVLLAQGGKGGVLIREEEAGPNRLALTKGLALLRGDRIETARGADVPCTSVRLEGGATVDLDRATSIELLGRDNLRFRSGRIYAHIAVPYPEDSYPEVGPPFSLQTDAGRFLTHNMQAELYLSRNEVLHKDLSARVDSGKVHLVNQKGHTVGRKGQELRARKGARPTRAEGFSKPIWRGRGRNHPNLPFGRSNPLIFSTATLTKYYGTHYALALAFRGEIRLVGLQASQGDPQQESLFRKFLVEAPKLQRYGPGCFPLPVCGTLEPLPIPDSERLKETEPTHTDAALQILAEARGATSAKPLVFLCHGSGTDLASAWLRDPGIAKKIVVLAALPPKSSRWWQRDPWAGQIVLRYFRCVLLPNEHMTVDPARLQRITDPRWASMVNKNNLGDWNSRLLCFLVNPDPKAQVTRLRFRGVRDGKPVFEASPKGKIWRLPDVPERAEVLDEFDRVFLAPAQVRNRR